MIDIDDDFNGLVTGDINSPTWPKTAYGWCSYFKALDRRHGTTAYFRGTSGMVADQLHHDHRCPVHGTQRRQDR